MLFNMKVIVQVKPCQRMKGFEAGCMTQIGCNKKKERRSQIQTGWKTCFAYSTPNDLVRT